VNYKDVISANDEAWKVDARKLLEKGDQFVVINLTQQAYHDCIALSQEFDYKSLIEEQGEQKEFVQLNFPDVLPRKLGLVPRNAVTRNPPMKK
jgi:hypothetical protein